MPRSLVLTLLALASTCFFSAHAFYSKNSPVLEVTGKTYDSLIAQSNHTSIVEFYAPWCGHCQNLKPAYEKAAKNLAGLAKVAAINCDDDANKPFCGQMGVQGFPTLKIVKPGSKPGRPVVEDYNGARTAKGIVEAVKDKIPNHVKRLQGSTFDTWFKDESIPAKAVIFTEKGTTSPLIKSLAVDFLGNIAFAQVKDKATAEKYDITDLPAVLLVPGKGEDPIPYKGEINRDSLLSFFSQVASPNPDPAPKGSKAAKSSKKPKASSSASAKFSRASEAHKSSDFDDFIANSGTIILDDDTPTESPIPIVDSQQKPIVVPLASPPLPTLSTSADLEAACLSPKSANCMLVLLPAQEDPDAMSESATSALAGFAEIVEKYKKRGANLIPIHAVPAENEAAIRIRQDLGIKSAEDLEVIALNVKRGWWRQYTAETYDMLELESFIDAIKLGEGSRQKLPSGFAETASEDTLFEPEAEPLHEADEPFVEDDISATGPEPKQSAASDHDEL